MYIMYVKAVPRLSSIFNRRFSPSMKDDVGCSPMWRLGLGFGRGCQCMCAGREGDWEVNQLVDRWSRPFACVCIFSKPYTLNPTA